MIAGDNACRLVIAKPLPEPGSFPVSGWFLFKFCIEGKGVALCQFINLDTDGL